MKTCSVTPADIKKNWLTVDATGQTLGRLCTQIALVLRGKHKANFVPHLDCGDHVVVLNANKIKLSGKKWDDKIYYNHSGYIGGIKAISAQDLWKAHPERLVEFAVQGMLPKSKLGRSLMKNLQVYPDDKHPHAGQSPIVMPPRLGSGV